MRLLSYMKLNALYLKKPFDSFLFDGFGCRFTVFVNSVKVTSLSAPKLTSSFLHVMYCYVSDSWAYKGESHGA